MEVDELLKQWQVLGGALFVPEFGPSNLDGPNTLLKLVRDVSITDRPAYKYRGLMLDTARNYFSVKSIKETIDAMAAVKLNTFHWHITDSQSFPFVSEKRPELSKYGAYSPSKIYTKSMIWDIVQYAAVRGVRVLPELDAPAHVGAGFPLELLTCYKAQPWRSYCVEPPCGQFNPIKDELYDYLDDLYSEMAEAFKSDMFHMGGDEVSEKCWNMRNDIRNFLAAKEWPLDRDGHLLLWEYFQGKAQEKVYKGFGKTIPLILWTSTLTNYQTIEKFLNKNDFIIQVWTSAEDPQMKGLLDKGFRIIISHYDVHYLDCGFGGWVEKGQSWCQYNSWQKIYDTQPQKEDAKYDNQILGAEVALWSEASDESQIHSRVWPRAAALAERLWSDPLSYYDKAEPRMHSVRDRLVRMGIGAGAIQPEWCAQNQGECGP